MTIDQVLMGVAAGYPGVDPRQWVSYGSVDEDTGTSPEERSVRFVDDDGEPLPVGPIVSVTLQPSGIRLPCRLATHVAGEGEGEYMPFMARDEVVVLIPNGNERSGGVIIGRCNQEIDTFPLIVAGQDVTKNNFGFRRLRVPYIIETAESYLIRSARTGSQIGIDGEGQLIFANGDKNNIIIGSDVISFSSGDESVFLQLDLNDKKILIVAGDARIEVSADETLISAPGAVNIGSGGARGKGHAVTAEQVFAWIANTICAIASVQGFNNASPLGVTFPVGAVGTLNGLMSAIVGSLAAPIPIGIGGAPGGNMAPLTASFSTIAAALADPVAISDPTGLIPGAGRGSLSF